MSRLVRLVVCSLSFVLAVASLSSDVEAAEAGKYRVYFGAYTGEKSRGIYTADLDLATGKLSEPRLAAEAVSPSFLAIHPNGHWLYAVSEIDDLNGRKTGGVSAFAIEADGGLRLLNQQPSEGRGPCHVTVDPSGKFALVANYGSGSAAALPIAADGRLGAASSVVQHEGKSVNPQRQPDSAARAKDVLVGLYNRLDQGQDVDASAVEAVIGMANQPALDGIISAEVAKPAAIMIRTRKKTIVPRSARQTRYMEALASDDMIFALGPAGTGKTYLAVAQAVAMLISGQVDRLILSRPAVEAGERLGFLPGDMKEKVDPYLRPLYDALYDMLPTEQVERRIASGEIEIAPIAFMRGRTLSDAFIILDEAQNTTPQQMKMFLTRFGMRSRMVICGDPNQIDLPRGQESGSMTRSRSSRASPSCR